MSRDKLWLLPATLAVILFTACAPTATPAAPRPTATLAKPAAPRPGATFSGPIEISEKASSGTIKLTVSEDGASITSVDITLKDLKCNGFSAGSMAKQVRGPFAVIDGNLVASVSGMGEIRGRFASPTQASGTVNLTLEIPFAKPCKLGEWRWSAKAD